VEGGAEQYVLQYRDRKRHRPLMDDAHGLAHRAGIDRRRIKVLPPERHRSAGDAGPRGQSERAVERLDDRGLAAARRSHDRVHRTFGNVRVDPVHDLRGAVANGEALERKGGRCRGCTRNLVLAGRVPVPTPQEAADLRQPRSAPVLVWGSVNADPQGRLINYDSSVFAAARVSIVIEEED
jgi:hypothetical protein